MSFAGPGDYAFLFRMAFAWLLCAVCTSDLIPQYTDFLSCSLSLDSHTGETSRSHLIIPHMITVDIWVSQSRLLDVDGATIRTTEWCIGVKHREIRPSKRSNIDCILSISAHALKSFLFFFEAFQRFTFSSVSW